MSSWVNILKVLVLFIGIIVIGFNAELYFFCKQQRAEINSMKNQQNIELQLSNHKFKYQQDRIEHLSKDLDDAQQQIKDQDDALSQQKDTLLQEIEKRQQVEDTSKGIQTSLVDIKAEADAIKQDMKNWQKDYVSVLAELEKKMDGSQYEIKSFEDNLTALNIPELKTSIQSLKADLERMSHPADTALPDTSSSPEHKIDRESIQ